MAKKKKINKGAVAYWTIVLAIAAFLTLSIVACDEKKTNKVERTYELIDKTTEVRTHRYLIVENAVETDHILVWKSQSGRTFSVEAGRNSYYHYQIGKKYKFQIDPSRSESSQIRQFCY